MAITMDDLMAMSFEEIQETQRIINLAFQRKSAQMKSTFRYNDLVEFKSTKRLGGIVRGFVRGTGPKNVSLVEQGADGRPMEHIKWRVHPSFLKKVEVEVKPVATPVATPAHAAPSAIVGKNAGTF